MSIENWANVAQNVKKVASMNLKKPKVAENSKSCQNSKKLPKISKVAEKLPSNLWLSLAPIAPTKRYITCSWSRVNRINYRSCGSGNPVVPKIKLARELQVCECFFRNTQSTKNEK